MSTNEKRIKSAEGLSRCPTCRRHVVAAATPSETMCPFCARRTPNAFRGAALATSLLAFGCGASEPASTEPTQEPTTQEPTEPVATDPVADPEPAPVAETEPEPTAETEQEAEPDPEPDSFATDPAPSMMRMARYGRVPIRRPGGPSGIDEL